MRTVLLWVAVAKGIQHWARIHESMTTLMASFNRKFARDATEVVFGFLNN